MRQRVIAAAVAAAALTLGGCGGDDDEPDRAATPTATPAATEPGDEATETATPTATATATGGAAEGGPAQALAEQTVQARGARDTTVDIRVLSLAVAGRLATLTLEFSAHDPSAAPDDTFTLYDLNGSNTLFVTLLDTVNLRRYKVVQDTSGQFLESRDSRTAVPLDGTATAEYTFAAPPADVTEIDVSVGDWPTFRDVPIER